MPLTTRPLTRDDLDKSDALIDEAFGELPSGTTPQSADDPPRPGTTHSARLTTTTSWRGWQPVGTTRGSAAAP